MSNRLAVGVLGVGHLGRYHALIYSRRNDVDLIGVVDTDVETARRVADEAGCDALTDPAGLLGRVDAVSVVVPTPAHRDVACLYLDDGVHVLLEKPIAGTVAQGAEIVSAADRSGVILQIGHIERFNAGIVALAGRTNNPRFIEAHRMSPFVARVSDVDLIADLMIHDIDIVLSLIDADITHISAVGTPVLTDQIDIANARIEFSNGAAANVSASRVSREKLRLIRAFEQHSYLSLDINEQRLDIAYPRDRDGGQWPEVATERIDIAPNKPLDDEIGAFIESVRTGKRPLVDGQAGLRALEVALQVKNKIEAA